VIFYVYVFWGEEGFHDRLGYRIVRRCRSSHHRFG